MPLSYSPIDFFKEYQEQQDDSGSQSNSGSQGQGPAPAPQTPSQAPAPTPVSVMSNDQLAQLMIEQNFLLRILILIGVFFVVIRLLER